jgi:hypothetical protein
VKALAIALTFLAGGALVLAVVPAATPESTPAMQEPTTVAPNVSGCLACHVGIEDMHPEANLSCVDCHGGDDKARRKNEAHVASLRTEPPDERVPPIDEDLAYRRFVNPMDLRVAGQTCGRCHADLVAHLAISLHGTTSGHLSDGYYEMGLEKERGGKYSVFPVSGPTSSGEVESFRQVPAFRGRSGSTELSTHYTDLARKECLQCHLWSQGRAVRGRVGFDGDYRGEGCAACHVEYAHDGLSRSRDKSALRTEPGHARTHAMTRSPGTQTCTTCHWGDAAIGLNFRGLAQLPPGAAGGPDIPGTTRALENRQYYLQDPGVNPPDVHHQRGMHCIDCHTIGDVMGDGKLHGAMEDQVEISCSDCHGTFTARTTLSTQRGNRVSNLRRDGDKVILTSKVTGEEHDVVQVVDVLDPKHPRYNERAAKAMTAAHANVECYTCHAGWNPNLLGFHFDRNESLTQLDLLTGRRTEGRVTTQEKVFATWKSFYAGLNERGAVAPYLTGFSTMGSATDARGERILDQVMPVTAAGLSGVTMIHHQMHTTRKTARSCVECHRSSATWGMGSGNFELARQLLFVADRRGIEVVALNRAQIATSVPLAKVVLPDVTALAIRAEPLQGFATEVFAAEGRRGVHAIDVRDPTRPRKIGFVATVEPHGLAVAGDVLYVADGPGGLLLYDVSTAGSPRFYARVATVDAQSVHVQWPYAYVADGPGGLAIVDVRSPTAPRAVGGLVLPWDDGSLGNAIQAHTIFQYSRPRTRKSKDGAETTIEARTVARNTCAVLDEERGLLLVDVTEPTRPILLHPQPPRRPRSRPAKSASGYRGMAVASHVDLAQPQGGTRTTERDIAWILYERDAGGNNRTSSVTAWDFSDPTRLARHGQSVSGQSGESLTLACFYNAPFLQKIVLACGEDGVFATDVGVSTQLNQLGVLGGLRDCYVAAVETFPLDRMVDEHGRQLKDVSHEGSRWLRAREIERILSVPPGVLGLIDETKPRASWPLEIPRREFARVDADRSGFLAGDEATGAVAQADEDGDGRVSFREFASWSKALSTGPFTTGVAPEGPRFKATRVDPDGDIARLLDLVDPARFDKDDDARLSRAEMDAAWFAALDLDGDHALSKAELSRNPGNTRRIRYGGPQSEKTFAAVDIDASGKVGPAELRVHDDEWDLLDPDKDGFVQLRVRQGTRAAKSGRPEMTVEWPARRGYTVPLPPGTKPETVLALLDKDGDKNLSRRELEKRPDLLYDRDIDGSGALEANELKIATDILSVTGVDFTRDGFVERWDIDGDGKVSAGELSVVPWLRSRLGL